MQNIESASDYAKRNNILFEYLKFHRQLEMNLSENIKFFLSPPKNIQIFSQVMRIESTGSTIISDVASWRFSSQKWKENRNRDKERNQETEIKIETENQRKIEFKFYLLLEIKNNRLKKLKKNMERKNKRKKDR
jgi:hypothetical protein